MITKAVPPFAKLTGDKYDADSDEIGLAFDGQDGDAYSIRFPATLAPTLTMRIMTRAAERSVAQEKPQPMYPLRVESATPLQAPDGTPVLGLHMPGNVLLTLEFPPEALQTMKLAIADLLKSLEAPPARDRRH